MTEDQSFQQHLAAIQQLVNDRANASLQIQTVVTVITEYMNHAERIKGTALQLINAYERRIAALNAEIQVLNDQNVDLERQLRFATQQLRKQEESR